MWLLRLYVSHHDALSAPALMAVRELCSQDRTIGCKLQVVDLESQANLAAMDGVKTAPTLVRLSPPPVQIISPDAWEVDSIAGALGMPPK